MIDTTVAHASRVYDYLLGGDDNFAVDRDAAHHIFDAYPGGVEGVKVDVRTNRSFLGSAVRYAVGEEGIRQILDIGTGIPNPDNAHGAAHDIAPDSRVVYVDNDPIVLAHAHSLLKEEDTGRTAYVDGDLREPEQIIRQAGRTLDFARPVALLLVGIMHVIPDDDRPYELVGRLVSELPSGSLVALSQLASDVEPDGMAEVSRRVDLAMGTWNPAGFRTRAQVEAFFEGLDLVEPGVVLAHEWLQARAGIPPKEGRIAPLYCGVGRKP